MGESIVAIACLTISTLMEPRKHFGKKYVWHQEGHDWCVKKFCRVLPWLDIHETMNICTADKLLYM
jgi:hypothetical protein